MSIRRLGAGVKWIISTFLFVVLLGATNLSVAQQMQAPPQEEPRKEKPEKVNARTWAEQVTGHHYYLRKPDFPLLINDRVEVTRCRIRYELITDLDATSTRGVYRAKIRLQGVAPAPQSQIRLEVDEFQTLDELYARLAREFSPTPLEEAFAWPQEIKRAVRARYIALGMDKQMVDLALGGLGYQVDLERLDDGRVRETWKLQVEGDTRRVFTTRKATTDIRTEQSGQVSGGIVTSTDSLVQSTDSLVQGQSSSRSEIDLTGSSIEETTATTTVSGFFIFSGLPPQFLNIIFTDGKVTARKTEFVK